MFRLTIFLLLIIMFSGVKPLSGKEHFPGEIPESLALKIGQRLHLSPKQGCATCHTVDGTGGAKAGAANLRTPTSWKSSLIAKNVNQLGVKVETTRSIAVGLILNGAAKWNKEFYNRSGHSKIKDKIFFDKRMIGVHSTALKNNRRMAKRLLKKNKKKIGGDKLLRVMAESVYLYIAENIFEKDERK